MHLSSRMHLSYTYAAVAAATLAGSTQGCPAWSVPCGVAADHCGYLARIRAPPTPSLHRAFSALLRITWRRFMPQPASQVATPRTVLLSMGGTRRIRVATAPSLQRGLDGLSRLECRPKAPPLELVGHGKLGASAEHLPRAHSKSFGASCVKPSVRQS